ncbi:hypothetical protein C0991_001960, partial [Blastosporella zonata]
MLTLIEFCISEWKSGKFMQGVFSEKQCKASYDVHFVDLKAWHFLNEGVVINYRKKLYERTLR